jgi:hypothetical protein
VTLKRDKPRKFIKEKSVFKTFALDSLSMFEQMMKADNQYSKIKRVIKQATQQEDVEKVLLAYYPQIKEIFQFYSSMSNYPSIGWVDFVEM